MHITSVKASVIASGSLLNLILCELFGGWSDLMTTLVIVMLIDYAMGLCLAAFFQKSKKTKSGKLSSSVGLKGIIKKVFELAIVAAAYRIGIATNFPALAALVTGAFVANEVVSIMENAGRMGILPKRVQELLDKAIDILNGKENGDEHKT